MPRLKATQRRRQLIDVATRLFASFGYDATTTAAIAKAAGITEPILYRHFKNKQELFVAIVRSVSEETLRQWQEIIAHTSDPAQRIKRVCEAIPDHMKRLADAYHVLHGALSLSRDKKVLAVMREHYRQIEKFFAELIVEGQRSGSFRKGMDPKAAAYHLIFAGIGYAMINLNLGQMDRRLIDEVIDSMVRGMKN
ncbi:MAG: TetR/AcrR family transcriptional regulator [Tepidisphaeraceae bacterium]